MLQSHYWATSNFSSPKGFFDDDLQKWKGATKDALDYELVQQAALPPESFTKQEVSNYYRKKLSETTDPAERIAWFQRLVENEAAGTEDIVNKKFFSEWIAFLLGKTDPKTVEYKTISETPWHLPDETYHVGTGLVKEGRWKLEEQPPIRRQDEGGKEIRAYINTFTDRHFDFMMKIISLKLNGPKTLNDHWLFFKYIVKGHAKDFGTRPLPELFLDYKDFMDPGQQNNVFTDAKSVTATLSNPTPPPGDDTGYSRFIQDDPGTEGGEPMQHDTGGDKSKNVSESYIQKLYNRYNSKPTTDNIFDAKVLTFTKDLLDKENARKARERLDVEPDPRIKEKDVPYDKPDKDLSAEEREANRRWEKRMRFIETAETAELKKLKEQQWDNDQKRRREFLEIKKKTKGNANPDYEKYKKIASGALKELDKDNLNSTERKKAIQDYNDALKFMSITGAPPAPPLKPVPFPKTPPPNPNTNPTGPPLTKKPVKTVKTKTPTVPPQQQPPQTTTTGQQQTTTTTTTTTQSPPPAETSPPTPTPTTPTTQPEQPAAETKPKIDPNEAPKEGMVGNTVKFFTSFFTGKDEKKLLKEAAGKLFPGTEITEEHQKYAGTFLKFLEDVAPGDTPVKIIAKWKDTMKNVPETAAVEMVGTFLKDELKGEAFYRDKIKIFKESAPFVHKIFGIPAAELLLQGAVHSKKDPVPITYFQHTNGQYLDRDVLANSLFQARIDFSKLTPLEQDILTDMYTFPISSNAAGFKLAPQEQERIKFYKDLLDGKSTLFHTVAKHAELNQSVADELAKVVPDPWKEKTLKDLFHEDKYHFTNSENLNRIFKKLWGKKEDPVPPPQVSEVASSKSLESLSPGQ